MDFSSGDSLVLIAPRSESKCSDPPAPANDSAAATDPSPPPPVATSSATIKPTPTPTLLGKPQIIPHKLTDPNLQQIPTEELLGSVTTFYPSGDAECGHALRTSARVIHKMRMDSIRGSTPPPADKKEGGPGAGTGKGGGTGGAGGQAKTPNQQKQVRMVWSNQDKNLFFEALNECGKDFEGIVNYLNTKKRRKDLNSEHAFKIKDVRHLYYQFNQKVSKYLHFSDEVKKEAQELYALINYGEMRKKVPFQNKKYFHKLKDLVYKGVTTIREKGRNIRIKTPSCRALRKLNQLEEWQEEIKLPPRIDVVLKPATVEAWGRVQSLAQNPRVKISVTLQKRLSTLLQLLQQKWRHQDVRLVDRINNLKTASANITAKASRQKTQHELELCARMVTEEPNVESQKMLRFTAPKGTVIHRPMINLSEFLSSYSICLNSFEQRIGAKVRGEALCLEKLNSFKERMGANSKRQRHDSGSEKHSPDGKKVKAESKDVKEEKVCGEGFGGSFVEVFKSPNASNESIELAKLDIDGSDGECPSSSKTNLTVVLGNAECSSDVPDLKSPDSNDSLKLFGISKIKLEIEPLPIGDTNSNDGVTLDIEQASLKAVHQSKLEEGTETTGAVAAAGDDLIKTTVKRKEPKEKCSKRKDSKGATGMSGLSSLHFRPLISEETIQKVREGWTLQNVGDLTVGDLYIMFGEESRLQLEYAWVLPKEVKVEQAEAIGESSQLNGDEQNGSGKEVMIATDPASNGQDERYIPNNEINLSGRLKQLLSIANLSEKTGKRRCPCGHVCDRRIKIMDPSASAINDNLLFKLPMVPNRNSGNVTATLANCNILPSPHMRYKQSRWWRMRVNRHQLSSPRVMLPNGNGSPQYSAGSRNQNNNNYVAVAAKVNGCAGSSGQNSQQAVGGTNGSSNSKNSNGNNRKPNDDDSLTKLLEDKINSFQSSKSKDRGASTNLTSSIPLLVSADGATDEGSLSLFDISLPSTSSTLIADLMGGASVHAGGEHDADGDDLTTISTTRILRESPVDGKILETDINDISLSSFLGHLDAVYENEAATRKRDNDMNISIISESSVDYIARFEDIAAELRAQQQQQQQQQ